MHKYNIGGIKMNVPKELRYSEEHEWVKVEGDNSSYWNYRFCSA